VLICVIGVLVGVSGVLVGVSGVLGVLVGVSGGGMADRVVHQISCIAVARAPSGGAGNLLADYGAADYGVVNPECGTPR